MNIINMIIWGFWSRYLNDLDNQNLNNAWIFQVHMSLILSRGSYI